MVSLISNSSISKYSINEALIHPNLNLQYLSSNNSLNYLPNKLVNKNDSSNNVITLPRLQQFDKIIVYSILFLIASIGNTTSFIALLFMKKRGNLKTSQSRIRLLFMNLCVADLMVTYIIMPLEIIWAVTDSWLAGDFACKLMMFLRAFGLYLSSFIIISITIDRFYAIVKPMEVDKVYRLNKLLLAFAWLLSFLSSLPQVFVFEVLTHPQDPTFKQCVTFGKLNTMKLKLAYNLYHFMGCYGTPLLIMIFCYVKIFLTIATHTSSEDKSNLDNRQARCFLRGRSLETLPHVSIEANKNNVELLNSEEKSLRFNVNNTSSNTVKFGNHTKKLDAIKKREKFQIEGHLRRSTNETYQKAKYKTLRLSALIVLAFIFFWTPYYFSALWAIVNQNTFNKYVNKKVKNYLFTFSILNSCFNPIIYGIYSNKLYEFLPCLRQKSQKQKSFQRDLISSMKHT